MEDTSESWLVKRNAEFQHFAVALSIDALCLVSLWKYETVYQLRTDLRTKMGPINK